MHEYKMQISHHKTKSKTLKIKRILAHIGFTVSGLFARFGH